MKKRADKQKEVEALKTELTRVSTVILTTFQGITVEQDTRLRRAVESAGGRYQVVKNTLIQRAGEGTPAEPMLRNLKGTNSIAYTTADPVTLAKVLTKVAKDVPAFKFRAGMVEGRVLSIEEIQALAALPSREEVLAKLLFLINAPAQRLVTVMNAAGRDLAVVIDQGVKENKFAGEAPAPSES